jgi:hypothetical protein
MLLSGRSEMISTLRFVISKALQAQKL